MMDPASPLYLGLVLTGAVLALLLLIVRLKVPAFFSLMLISACAGLLLGVPPTDMAETIRAGMGSVLGFIAVVVGLGAMLGALLERAGGVEAVAAALVRGKSAARLPWMMGLIGLIVAIPVFFDVALIILAPVLFRLAARAGRPLLFLAVPLLAGLGAAHAFIPPTPGPVAVAALMKADLGLVILFGALAGIPAAAVGGPLFAYVLFRDGRAPAEGAEGFPEQPRADQAGPEPPKRRASLAAALVFILLPLVLIAGATVVDVAKLSGCAAETMRFIGHPFTALLIAVALSYAHARMRLGLDARALNQAAARALEPAGAVILVTGAGGVFKQVLVDSGAGVRIAEAVADAGLPLLGFAFVIAAVIRIAQGSATVAMITAAGLAAPVAQAVGADAVETALAAVAVAAGATVLSHVNDSGFWLVSRYLGLTEMQTLKSWTVASTLVGLTGFAVVLALGAVL
ncbi:GntP family permease [Amphiplicatus metriothermophilus]|uniref:Gnt-I system low-affinity gluconate transporter n=1 Tax=Amphiplicatus metriothermophilus TaxID=1519374 RepID=A0A239PUX5_9PROT|nr:gluconate:H+ symporter [Amphiplicatus metriothermophilus]MBB5519498.1 Gnt-I system low-affinity gluconate transporter [Amphiplicatus metriothermophilus]SNT74065.1 Gnt-I system low-affinity gluconate transporter [Amphiplicatus metriothermophilus]